MIRIRLRQRGYALSPSVRIAFPSLMAKKKMKKKWKAALIEKNGRYFAKHLSIHTFCNFTSDHHIYLIRNIPFFAMLSNLYFLFPSTNRGDPRQEFSYSRWNETKVDGLSCLAGKDGRRGHTDRWLESYPEVRYCQCPA